MIKAVVFDLDDTLISELDYIKSGFKVVANTIANDYKLEKEDVYQMMNELFEEDHKRIFNRLLDNLKIEYDLDYIKFLVKTYREHEPNIKFFDDVILTIQELKKRGYKIGLITDGYKETQRAKIKALDCEYLFDEIIVTDELGRQFWKPHEKAYRMMSEKLRCEFKNMTYVGDNEEKDFVTANKLKIKTICVNSGLYKGRSVKDKFRAMIKIENLVDIIKIQEEWFEKDIICNNSN